MPSPGGLKAAALWVVVTYDYAMGFRRYWFTDEADAAAFHADTDNPDDDGIRIGDGPIPTDIPFSKAGVCAYLNATARNGDEITAPYPPPGSDPVSEP